MMDLSLISLIVLAVVVAIVVIIVALFISGAFKAISETLLWYFKKAESGNLDEIKVDKGGNSFKERIAARLIAPDQKGSEFNRIAFGYNKMINCQMHSAYAFCTYGYRDR